MNEPNRASSGQPVTASEMAEFLSGLRRRVLDEAATQRYELLRLWSRPLPERVALGRAIEGLSVARISEAGRLVLRCDRNDSRFREGDLLRINRGNPAMSPSLQMTLERDDETELEVAPLRFSPISVGELFRERDGWILDEDALDTSQYVLDALDEAADSTIGRSQVLPLLMGRKAPAMSLPLYERGLGFAEAAGLNWNQIEAVAQGYATDSAYLIQGPPGTGKTRVLAHLAELLVDDGARVLITAHTHRAIGNALNTLSRHAPLVPAVKIGATARAADLTDVENYEHFGQSPLATMSRGYAVGATPFATRTKRLSGVEFDVAIFDEASQITLPLALMGMLTARRYVFIGDHRQLPPVAVTRDVESALMDSVFGVLVDRGFDTLLNETYRLNADLTAWPSAQFYEGQLVCVPEIARRRLSLQHPPEHFIDILDPDAVKVFVDLGHRNATTVCQREASLVVDLIAELLSCGVPPSEIGVVAPYRAQSRAIRNLLRVAVPWEERQWIVVDTVERMQGQERDVIILSLTTSNPAFAAHLADFFFQPERLNVAITRPRTKLIIVGSRHVLEARPTEPQLQIAVELLGDLISGCRRCVLSHGA